ncbi:hypothetical protein ACKFKF_20945 [Phormidesmis sp. 146-12]
MGFALLNTNLQKTGASGVLSVNQVGCQSKDGLQIQNIFCMIKDLSFFLQLFS